MKTKFSDNHIAILNSIFQEKIGNTFSEVLAVLKDPFYILQIDSPTFFLKGLSICKNPDVIFKLNNPDLKLWALAKSLRFDLEIDEGLEKKVKSLSRKISTSEWAFNLVNAFMLDSLTVYAFSGMSMSKYQLIKENSKVSSYEVFLQFLNLTSFMNDNRIFHSGETISDESIQLCYKILDCPFKGESVDIELLIKNFNKKTLKQKILQING